MLLPSQDDWPSHPYESDRHRQIENSRPPLSPKDVVVAVNKGLQRGSKDFGIMTRSILCCITHKPGMAWWLC